MTNKTCVCTIIGPRHTGRSFKGGVGNSGYTLKDGSSRSTFSLLDPYRENGESKHHTLLNLGGDFAIPRDQWPHLTTSIEAKLKGESALVFYDDETFHRTVDDIVTKLLDQGYDIYQRKRFHFIDPEQTEPLDTRTFVGERACLNLINTLGIADMLVEIGMNQNQAKRTIASIIGRMLSPGSEVHTADWIQHQSSILSLLDLESANYRSLYRCAETLYDHRHAFIEKLYGPSRAMLQDGSTLMLYDLTNTFYTGKKRGELLEFGVSKEKRKDCPLVSLSLMIDGSGLVRNVEILPGNISEPKTLKQAVAPLIGSDATVIMDAGIATQENLMYLKEQQLDWIAVDRRKSPPMPSRAPECVFETADGVPVKAWALTEEESPQTTENADINQEEARNERCICVHSQAKQGKEEAIHASKCKKYIEEVTQIHEGLSKPNHMKNYTLILVRLGRLKQKYGSVSGEFEVKVTPKPESEYAESVTITRREGCEEGMADTGVYILRTSHTDWDVQETVKTYWRLTEIEAGFKMMKSDLGLRPIFHHDDKPIGAHLFITVIAYHLINLLRKQLAKGGIRKSWKTIRNEMNQCKRVTTRLETRGPGYIIVKADQKLSPFLSTIFQILRVRYSPRSTRIVEVHRVDDTEPKGSSQVENTPPPEVPPDS